MPKLENEQHQIDFVRFICFTLPCRYYHNETDIDDNGDQQQPSRSTENVENVENSIEIPEINLNNNDDDFIGESALDLDIPSSGLDETDIDASNRESSPEEKSTRAASVLTEINIEAKNNRNTEKIVTTQISTTPTPTIISPLSPSSTTPEIITDQPQQQQLQQLQQPKAGCSTDTAPLSSSTESDTSTINVTIQKMRKLIDSGGGGGAAHTAKLSQQSIIGKPSSLANSALAGPSSGGIDAIKRPKAPTQRTAMISNQSSFKGQAKSASNSNRDYCCSDSSGRYSHTTNINSGRSGKKKESTAALQGAKLNTGNNTAKARFNRKTAKNVDIDSVPRTPASGCSSTRSAKRSVSRKYPSASGSHNTSNLNISSDFCKDPNRTHSRDEQSNMFLYIDLHGHASKKGIFMYGNYLPNIAESVECMLLPRLMSMNSHHFHFDACVFSERNMYHKCVFIPHSQFSLPPIA